MDKYITRTNEPCLFESFDRPFVSAILGPRRVGKTTLLSHYISKDPEKKWVTLNMDSLSLRKRVAAEELEAMIEQESLQQIGRGKKIWVFIDEAQKCPELFDQVKILYDKYKGRNQLKFILTGSAHLNLHKLSAESLAGRVELLHLREFNLKELTYLLHEDKDLPNSELLSPSRRVFEHIFAWEGVSVLEQALRDLRPLQKLFEEALENHVLWGGLPETFGEKSDQFHLKYLGDYIQTYLEKDVRAIDTISDVQLFENVMRICAEQTGSLRDDTKILQALHCSRGTLSKYRDYLQATLQYTEVHPFVESSIKRLVKSPKGYLHTNGLLSYLTGIHNLSILKTTGLIGHRLENWFLNEIQIWLDTRPESHHISFWRTATGLEVDFVVSLGGVVVPFEIAYTVQGLSKKVNTLKKFMADSSAKLGIICYPGQLAYDNENHILYLPAWMV